MGKFHLLTSTRRSSAIILLVSVAATSMGDSVSFFQNTFALDNAPVVSDSAWGSVNVEYSASSQPKYFNLVVNGELKVQNALLFNYSDVGSNQVQIDFDLGSARTGSSRSLQYGYSFSSSPISGLTSSLFGNAIDQDISQTSGFEGEFLSIGPAAGGNCLLGVIPAVKSYQHKDFPNQIQNAGECVPAAISNSLQWLNKKYGLKIADAELTIDKMKGATGYRAGFGAVGDKDSAKAWWRLKDKYVKDKKWGIETTVITALSDVYASLSAGADVEIRVPGHAAAIVGMAERDGKWELDIAHDIEQEGKAGSQVIQKITVDKTTKKITGGKWLDGKTFDYAVSEKVTPVPEPASIIALSAGMAALLRKRKKA